MREELSRPYMNLIMAALLIPVGFALLYLSSTSAWDEPIAAKAVEVSHVRDHAPSCIRAFNYPTLERCDAYKQALIDQGFVENIDGSFSIP